MSAGPIPSAAVPVAAPPAPVGAPEGPWVVTGMHRSGTTLVGRLLARHAGVRVIHEPLNPRYGLAGVDRVYPCDLEPGPGRAWVDRLGEMLDRGAPCVRRVPGDPPWKAAARALTGGRTGVDLARLGLRRALGRRPRPVLKDPFALLLTDTLTRRGGRAVVLVRHPAAVWLSLKRMGWRFDFERFACPDFFPRLGLHVHPEVLRRGSEVEKAAHLWAGLYAYVRRISARPSVCIVRHEDLCRDPFGTLVRIEGFLGLGPSAAARRYAAAHMFGGPAGVEGAALHVGRRDARALATAWREQIDPNEEAVLRAVCGAEAARWYGPWRPG